METIYPRLQNGVAVETRQQNGAANAKCKSDLEGKCDTVKFTKLRGVEFTDQKSSGSAHIDAYQATECRCYSSLHHSKTPHCSECGNFRYSKIADATTRASRHDAKFMSSPDGVKDNFPQAYQIVIM